MTPNWKARWARIAADLCRYNKDIGVFAPDMVIDLTNPNSNCPDPCNSPALTHSFQLWHRDGMNPSRFSDAIEVVFN